MTAIKVRYIRLAGLVTCVEKQIRCLAISFLQLRAPSRGAPHRKYSFPTIVASICDYRAVAWQFFDEVCYNIYVNGWLKIYYVTLPARARPDTP